MIQPTADTTALWPLGVYFLAVIVIVSIIIVLSSLLGERHREKQTDEPYRVWDRVHRHGTGAF